MYGKWNFFAVGPRIVTMGPPFEGFDWYVPYKVVARSKPTVHWMLNGSPLLASNNVVFNNKVGRECSLNDTAAVTCGSSNGIEDEKSLLQRKLHVDRGEPVRQRQPDKVLHVHGATK